MAAHSWRRAALWRRRLSASRFDGCRTCSGAPSHGLSQGSGLRRFSKWHYSRDLRPAKWGFNDKFALQKILNGPCPLWVLAVL
jgi:hypothetical protein